MKRFLLIAVALILALSLFSCGKEETESGTESSADAQKKVELDVKAEANAIITKYSLSGGRLYNSDSTVAGEYLDEDLVRSYYGDAAAVPNFSEVEAYTVYIDESKPIKPCEFGIFKMKDGANVEEFMLFLKARINLKIQNAKAYPTMDTEPLKTAVFTEKDGYIWYAVVKGGNSDIDNTLKGKFE